MQIWECADLTFICDISPLSHRDSAISPQERLSLYGTFILFTVNQAACRTKRGMAVYIIPFRSVGFC